MVKPVSYKDISITANGRSFEWRCPKCNYFNLNRHVRCQTCRYELTLEELTAFADASRRPLRRCLLVTPRELLMITPFALILFVIGPAITLEDRILFPLGFMGFVVGVKFLMHLFEAPGRTDFR